MLARLQLMSRLADARGFTLIETLLAMVLGLIVTLGAFAFLQVSSDETSRATNYLQASQAGRTTMNHIVDELNSACIKEGFTPVLAESTPEKLRFRDGFSEEAEISYSQIQLHEIAWAQESGKETGTLTDSKQIASAINKEGTEYTWGTASKAKIGTRIGKSGSEPIFRYYEYGTEAQSNTESGENPFKEIALSSGAKLSSAQAENVAAVQVAFRALPVDGKAEEKLGQSLALHTLVTFAFSAPIAEPTIADEPCQ